MNDEPTDRQLEVLEYMRDYLREHQMPPTLHEIAVAFDLRSHAGVHEMLVTMARKGLVTHRPNKARGWIPRSPSATGEV